MSVFDDLSLAMIPSGFKDGKLYSVIPSDGNGDFTFSRGTNLAATRVNAQGLIEKGRENLLTQSNTFSSSDWTKFRISETGGQSGYDGSNDAWLLQNSATSTGGNLNFQQTFTGVHTFSAYVKQGTSDGVRFRLDTDGGNIQVNFTLTGDGSINELNSFIDTKITSVGSGWYRCSATSKNINIVRVYTFDSVNGAGALEDNIYIQDAQLEVGLVATDYIETTTTTAQAGILEDMPRLDYSGGATCPSLLLEPQRSNIVTYSEEFSTGFYFKYSNASVSIHPTIKSPDGSLNATLVNLSTSNSAVFVNNASFVPTGYTKSIWARTVSGTGKANLLRLYNSDGYSQDNGLYDLTEDWQRFDIYNDGTASNDGYFLVADSRASEANLDEVLVWGAQTEQGSYPTSYIPTHGTSVTRNADTIATLDITNIITGDSFTWFLDLDDWQGSDSSKNELEISSSNNIKIQVRVRADGYRFYYFNIQGGTQFPVGGSTTANKFCVSYDGQNYRLYRDGVKVDTTSSVGDTGWNEFTNRGGLGTTATLPLKAMTIFDNALSDQECIDLTS